MRLLATHKVTPRLPPDQIPIDHYCLSAKQALAVAELKKPSNIYVLTQSTLDPNASLWSFWRSVE